MTCPSTQSDLAQSCCAPHPYPQAHDRRALLHPSTGGWPTRGRGGQTAHAAESWRSLGSTASPMAVPGRPDRTTSTRSILAAGLCATRGRRNPGATLCGAAHRAPTAGPCRRVGAGGRRRSAFRKSISLRSNWFDRARWAWRMLEQLLEASLAMYNATPPGGLLAALR